MPVNQSNQTRSAPQVTNPQAYQPGLPAHPQLAGMESAPIPRTKQFWISYRSLMDNILYEGQFTTRKMSIKDMASIGVRKVQLNGGYHHDENKPGFGIDAQTDWMNSMIAHLEVSIIQAPMWFKVEDIIDGQLLGKIFEQVMEFENSFFRSTGGADSLGGGSQDAGGAQGEGTGAAGRVAPLVGGQVPTSLEP